MIKYLLFALSLISYLQAEPEKLTAVTYNIRYDAGGDKGERDWNKRKGKVSAYLLNKQASIIGLQEVLHNQLEDVKKALPNHKVFGVGRSDGKTKGEYSPIFYHTKIWKADPKEQGTFWLSDTPERIASKSWGNGITRICSWARLTRLKSGKSIYVYNTHWDHRSQNSREKAAELILKKIRARSQKNEPFILMGDFNATTDNPAIKTLLTSGILTDPGKKQFRTFSNWKTPLIPGKRIDHIFVSKHWKNVTATVEANGDPAASDHHPVTLVGMLPANTDK